MGSRKYNHDNERVLHVGLLPHRPKHEKRIQPLSYECRISLRAWSYECRISIRMTNECHFLAPIDIRKCVSCSSDPLTGHSSLGNLRCLCVLLFSFVNAIRFSGVKSHSFLMRWPLQHYAAFVWPGLTHEERMTFNVWETNDVDKGENYHVQTTHISVENAFHARLILWLDARHYVTCVGCACYFSSLSTPFVSHTLKVIRSSCVRPGHTNAA